MFEPVIVRAFGGEPLERVAIAREDRGVLICRSDRIDAVKKGESEPARFPQDLVFAVDPVLLVALRKAYADGDKARLEELWLQLHAFQSNGEPNG